MTYPAAQPDPGPTDDEAAAWAALTTSVRAAMAPPVPPLDGEPPYRLHVFGPVRGSVTIEHPQFAAQLAWAAEQLGSTVRIVPGAHPDADLAAISRRRVVDELPAWARLLLGGTR